jgi:hypothetical protein
MYGVIAVGVQVCAKAGGGAQAARASAKLDVCNLTVVLFHGRARPVVSSGHERYAQLRLGRLQAADRCR